MVMCNHFLIHYLNFYSEKIIFFIINSFYLIHFVLFQFHFIIGNIIQTENFAY